MLFLNFSGSHSHSHLRRQDFYTFRESAERRGLKRESERNSAKERVVLWWFVVDYQRDKDQAVN